MTDLRLLEDYTTLFEGNPDAYGTETGGCVRKPPPWEEHLFGSTPIGIYPTYDPNPFAVSSTVPRRCNWGCIDLDVKSDKKPSGDYESPQDAMNAAINLTRALEALGLRGWVEQTRSDGRHVWVFKRTTMQTMRAALLVACQLAKVKPTEVNPKSFELGPDELGNYVRLPYPNENHNERQYLPGVGKRRVYLMQDKFYRSVNFVSAALEGVDDLSALEAAAKLYKPPTLTHMALERPRNALLATDAVLAHGSLRGLPGAIWRDGRLEGADRSGTLFKMACALVRQGYPQDSIASILEATDAKWFEKYTNRKNPWHFYAETAKNAQLASS